MVSESQILGQFYYVLVSTITTLPMTRSVISLTRWFRGQQIVATFFPASCLNVRALFFTSGARISEVGGTRILLSLYFRSPNGLRRGQKVRDKSLACFRCDKLQAREIEGI